MKLYCNGCEKETEGIRPIEYHFWARRDYFGIYTGIYCDECYNSGDSEKYPYLKERYLTMEFDGEGEQLYPEDF